MNTKERMVEMLPFYLQKGEKINAYFEVLSFFYDELIDVFNDIIENRDIDNAELFGLDLLGDIIVQKRTEKYADDEKYRNRLKTKVMQNNSMGYMEDLNSIADAFLGENFLGIKQGYQYKNLDNEPAMLEVLLSANKLESSTLDYNKRCVMCGTVESGTTTTGSGINTIQTIKEIKKYKPIFIPELQSAVSTGVRLQYRIKNDKETIKIDKRSFLKFKNKIQKLSFKKRIEKLIFKTSLKTIPIKTNVRLSKIEWLQCGTTSICAEMGVLL